VPYNLSSATIVSELAKREDRPWPEYHNTQPITARGVARLLGRFGVRPNNIRLGEGEHAPVAKGYALADLLPAFRAYLSPTELSATSATAVEPSYVAAVADNNRVVHMPDYADRGEAWEPPEP
jgi:uncharacterized protein DUF3631